MSLKAAPTVTAHEYCVKRLGEGGTRWNTARAERAGARAAALTVSHTSWALSQAQKAWATGARQLGDAVGTIQSGHSDAIR